MASFLSWSRWDVLFCHSFANCYCLLTEISLMKCRARRNGSRDIIRRGLDLFVLKISTRNIDFLGQELCQFDIMLIKIRDFGKAIFALHSYLKILVNDANVLLMNNKNEKTVMIKGIIWDIFFTVIIHFDKINLMKIDGVKSITVKVLIFSTEIFWTYWLMDKLI